MVYWFSHFLYVAVDETRSLKNDTNSSQKVQYSFKTFSFMEMQQDQWQPAVLRMNEIAWYLVFQRKCTVQLCISCTIN